MLEGESAFQWPQVYTPAAILISASVAIGLAYFGWNENRKLAREDAAVKMMLDHEPELAQEFRIVYWLIVNSQNFQQLAEKYPKSARGQAWEEIINESNLGKEQRQWIAVSRVLKFYESIAVCIERKLIDGKMAYDFLGLKLVWYVEKLFPFIERVRELPDVAPPNAYQKTQTRASLWGGQVPPFDC